VASLVSPKTNESDAKAQKIEPKKRKVKKNKEKSQNVLLDPTNAAPVELHFDAEEPEDLASAVLNKLTDLTANIFGT